MRIVFLRGASWIVPLLLWTAVAGAAPDPREMKAREAFAAGRYQDALDLFVKLYAEKLHPNYLRNIGRCYQNLGEPDRAISSFHEYLRKARKLTAAERAEIERYIGEMEELKRTQAGQKGDGADGKTRSAGASGPPGARPAAVDPPLAAAAAPPPPPPPRVVEREVAPVPARAAALDLSARPAPAHDEPSPVYTRWWFWAIVGGVVVVGVGGAVAAGVFTRKVDAPCDPGSTCR